MSETKKRGTNNPNGRPKGSPNKVTAELREKIKNFLEDNWSQIEQDFSELDPEKRFMMYEKLLQFALPKLSQAEIRTPDIAQDSELLKRARQRAEEIAKEGRD